MMELALIEIDKHNWENYREISGNAHLNAKGLTYNILNFGNNITINVASLDTLQKGLNIRIDDGTKLEKAKQAQEYLRYFKCCLCTSMLEINQNNLSTGRTPSKRPRNYGSTARSLF